MTSVDVGALAKAMVAAAVRELGKGLKEVHPYAKRELPKVAQALKDIAESVDRGDATEEQARILIDMQRHRAKSVLLTCRGLTELAAERAINAALRVAATTVNTALGFALF